MLLLRQNPRRSSGYWLKTQEKPLRSTLHSMLINANKLNCDVDLHVRFLEGSQFVKLEYLELKWDVLMDGRLTFSYC